MEIRSRDELKSTDGAKFGEVVQSDRSTRTLDVRKGRSHADTHPTALFAHSHVPTEVLEDSIFGAGEGVASGAGTALVQRLLLANPPSLRSGPFTIRPAESKVTSVMWLNSA